MKSRKNHLIVRLSTAKRLTAALAMGSMLGTGCLPRNFWADTAGSLLGNVFADGVAAWWGIWLAPAGGVAAGVANAIANLF